MTARRAALAVAVAVLVVVVALALLDTGPNLPVVAALTLFAIAATLLFRDVASTLAPPLPTSEEPDLPGAMPDLKITSLRQGLASSGSDDRLSNRIRQQLVAVTDDELLVAHGIDRHTDPAAARRALGPELYEFVDDPAVAQGLSVRRLERIVSQIERLGTETT